MEKCCNFADFQSVYRNAGLTAFHGIIIFISPTYSRKVKLYLKKLNASVRWTGARLRDNVVREKSS